MFFMFRLQIRDRKSPGATAMTSVGMRPDLLRFVRHSLSYRLPAHLYVKLGKIANIMTRVLNSS
jgi:hypothetical protein